MPDSSHNVFMGLDDAFPSTDGILELEFGWGQGLPISFLFGVGTSSKDWVSDG